MANYKFKYRFEIYQYGEVIGNKKFKKDEFEKACNYYSKLNSNDCIGFKVYRYEKLLSYNDAKKEFLYENNCRFLFNKEKNKND